jgi:hypothetical protein
MILTDYYKFERLAAAKSKTRLDCTASSKSYNPFESLTNKKGELFVYVGDNTHTAAGQKGKSDLAISHTKHISSVYRPDIDGGTGWGDVNGEKDALLFVFTSFAIVNGEVTDGAKVEIFVARGKRSDRQGLYNLLADGELDGELDTLRQTAKPLN